MDRRRFIASTGSLAGAAWVGKGAAAYADDRVGKELDEVPETLDLSDRATLAIRGMLNSLNPDLDYETVFLHILDVHPAYMLHWSTMISGVMPKYIEALPMLRTMSGNTVMQDIQRGFLDAMVRNASEDGLVYDRATERRPWNVGVFYGNPDWNEDYASMSGNGRMLAGFLFWNQITREDIWLKRAKKTAERMLELAVVRGDQAWYPNPGCGNDFSYPRVSGWTTKEPPASLDEGYEPQAVLFSLTQELRGFSRYYRQTGDERFVEVSKKFANFALQPKFWGGIHGMHPPAGAERGHVRGHFHASIGAMRALLDHAIVADDTTLKWKIRDGYEWVRQRGIHRLGLFPDNYEMTEGCTIADMVGLAVALSDAGLGDYWDDVEMYARNGLLAAQASDLEELRRVSQNGKKRPPESAWGGQFDSRFHGNNKGVLPGQEIHGDVLERTLGTFGHVCGARYLIPQMMSCCTANCSMGLYYAWEGIVRTDGESSEVNMWMNRRSPWIDVWSWLPHEGRMMVQNKGQRRISIRKPGWADPTQVRGKVDGVDVSLSEIGNRLVFAKLQGNETIEVSVPVTPTSGDYTMVNLNTPHTSRERYRCVFHGHSATQVDRIQTSDDPGDPYDGDLNWYRIFATDPTRVSETPMKERPEYVHSERIVKWTV